MQAIDKLELLTLLQQARVKKRLMGDLRFVPEAYEWADQDFIAIATKSAAEGVLIMELHERLVLPYALSKGLIDKLSGRSRSVTCDLCFTWQRGGKAARITFLRPSDGHKFSYLCCADLRCSLHVRGKTSEATLSRTQLHEDITPLERIERLRRNLQKIIVTLGYDAWAPTDEQGGI